MVVEHAVDASVVGLVAPLAVAAVRVPHAADACVSFRVACARVAVVVSDALHTLIALAMAASSVRAVGILQAP